jgi:2-oxoglutarate ferredoxin oxidoreductase subunit beta
MCESTTSRSTLEFIVRREPIEVEYAEGASQDVTMHDGTRIRLRKLDADHDFCDRSAALARLERCRAAGEIATGLFYLNEDVDELHDNLNTTTRPLNELRERELCPGSKALEAINASLR